MNRKESYLKKLVNKNKQSLDVLQNLYSRLSIPNNLFERDKVYLHNAFLEMSKLWMANFKKIKTVRYILIAEAPLWGESMNYIYNSNTPFTQFFYKSDLEKVLGKEITNKKKFLKILNGLGLLIIDISPFALNSQSTAINYSETTTTSNKITGKQYTELVANTCSNYFNEKIKLAKSKIRNKNITFIFRYERVESSFKDILAKELVKSGILKESQIKFENIWMNGGGIDVEKKLNPILTLNKTKAKKPRAFKSA